MADRTTNSRYFNEFSLRSDIGNAGGFANVQAVERMITNALKPLFDAGQILRRTVTEGGQQRTTFAFPGGNDIKQIVMASVREIVNSVKVGGDAFQLSNLSRRQYIETSDRILDQRTQAAIRAEAMRSGGMSRYDKQSGVTTLLTPARQAEKFQRMIDESDRNYLSGMGRSAPGYSSSANITEMAQAAIARKNAQMIAQKQAMADFNKSNPNSPLARAFRRNRRRKNFKMVKGGVMGVLSVMAGLLAVGVGISSKILTATMEVARNVLMAMNAGNKVNLTGVDVARYAGISESLGYDKGKNPFVDSMNMLVQRFANPENIGDLSKVATLLQGKTSDALKMITTGKVDPEQMLFDIFGDVATSIASGKGGVLNRSSLGAALSSALAAMSGAFDPGTADLFNNLITRMMNSPEGFQGGRIYSGDYFRAMVGKINPRVITPSEQAQAAAEVGNRNIQALGADVNSGLNKLLTDLVSWVGDIAINIRNLIAPLLNWLDPAGAPKRNAEAIAINRQYQSEVAGDIAFLGSEAMSEASRMGIKVPRGADPAMFIGTMKGRIDNYKTQADANAFFKDYGVEIFDALKFVTKYGQVVSDANMLTQLRKDALGDENGMVSFTAGADSITRASRAQGERFKWVRDQMDRRAKAERDLAAGNNPEQNRNIIANMKANNIPSWNEYLSSGNSKIFDEIQQDTSMRAAVNALFAKMRSSNLFGGMAIDPGDKLRFDPSLNGEVRVVLVEGNRETLVTSFKKSGITLEKPFTRDANSLIQEANASTIKDGQGGRN